ncbi:TetR/AcrR family transcriptional regulator [Leucobacter luti]|uniref:TetR family transcriptional regulator n=1 Tax=Leucobacter luti TaxID=340320 RepID=A0A4Q7U5X6_9MICO|nr:TetR/AcrR family transcriptional regulator [Leucobacter luti]MBL3700996.1 TetR/AcrR family transcriptional regulator [Leucobacter luti]RZT68783.1 TetR family transcriptional regulator [Leucobacter luti]
MPRIVDHDARRDEIAGAAWQVIARDGFDQLTMRNIAAEAGYAHSAFARYFPDKESLLTAAFLRTRSQADSGIAASTAGKRGIAALRSMCVTVLPLGEAGTQHARVALAFWNHAAQNRAFWITQRAHAEQWRARILQFLTEAELDGELAPGVEPITASDEIAAANMGWQTIKLLMPEFATDARMIAALDSLLGSIVEPGHPLHDTTPTY